ncbi:U3 small nucleolar ribonucleoprotein protein IMP4-like [Mizuhopecten yessoensis]|uniref:U3 small nucleolar ribonucleoprotein IMP4 n=1 Tax=Mizuhopecten yessoensis TaxID=6573 RepID=A0A210PZT5_MIZYE|nr:U3 small nucleolar ribonucleoprotein protein IMP4-like [Mizuhopecten yessoensis]OWF41988.1 U3 small nucleolar ribonucleoprotein IMP4 [Mizuhopecten yessoensis]
MLRRQARLRREFIYKKSEEHKERGIQDKKQRLKTALESGQPIPTDLRADAVAIQKTLAWDGPGAEGRTNRFDDEYKWAGVEDPKIVITTSRDPSSKLKQFAKEMRLIFPNSQRINRGNYETKQLMDACRSNQVTDLIMVHEHRGVPDALIVCHLPHGPTASFTLSNVVMRHDIPDVGTMSEAYPHLIFHMLSSRLGKRVKNILKYLFPVPKEDSKRIITFANDEDHISFRHHIHKKTDGGRNTELSEVGPRFEMKLYQIQLGTIDNADTADVEWVYRPYMNTAKKRKFLSN